MEFIGVYKDTDGKIKNNIYYLYQLWLRDTFSPATKIIAYIPLKVSGKNYNERKENLRQKAIEYQQTWQYCTWSYHNVLELDNFFIKNGERYGLLKEFKENGII